MRLIGFRMRQRGMNRENSSVFLNFDYLLGHFWDKLGISNSISDKLSVK